ncbi:MAG: hypothetical protein IPJ23_03880 [Ignavibacteriales bacterium]|nr:hypothetical protein [Ignavibacteriales bacterium]
MKKVKLVFLALLPVLLLNLTGCYTQVASRDNDYGNWNRTENKPYYDYQDEYDTTADSYEDEEYAYDDNEDSYSESYGTETTYSFYGYPSYRKYFWGYHPAVSIVVGSSWYYDPWCWDPWYPSYWSYPSPFCYYPTYWYSHNYYGWWDPYPYYGGYYSSTYKYRSNDGYKIRNNSGIRNSGEEIET